MLIKFEIKLGIHSSARTCHMPAWQQSHLTSTTSLIMSAAPTNPSRPHRYPRLDFWRGIGICIVIIGHAVALSGSGAPNGPLPAYTLLYAILGIGPRFIEFFFFVSGFLVCGIMLRLEGSQHPWLAYAKNRVRRLAPSFVAYIAVIFALHFLGLSFAGVLSTVPGGMWWVACFGTNWLIISLQSWDIGALTPHFWSLAVEEQLCLVAPVIFLALRRYPKVTGRCILAGIVLIPVAALIAVLAFKPDPCIFQNPLMQLDVFAFGMWLATQQHRPNFNRLPLFAWAMLCAPLVALVLLTMANDILGTLPETIVCAKLCGALWFVLVCRATSMARQPSILPGRWLIELMGRRIYGMYVWHNLVLHSLLWAIEKMSVDPTMLKDDLLAIGLFALSGLLLTLGLCQGAWIISRRLLFPLMIVTDRCKQELTHAAKG